LNEIIDKVATAMSQHDAEMHSIDGTPPEAYDFYEAMAEVAVKAFARAAIVHFGGDDGGTWDWFYSSEQFAMYVMDLAEVGQ